MVNRYSGPSICAKHGQQQSIFLQFADLLRICAQLFRRYSNDSSIAPEVHWQPFAGVLFNSFLNGHFQSNESAFLNRQFEDM